MHVDSTLTLDQLPRDCIDDCSAEGDVSEVVEHWRKKLDFTVNRKRAIRCIKGYGSYEESELREWNAERLARWILWIACCDFRDFIAYAEQEGIDWQERSEELDLPSGSDIFVLE